MTMTFSTQQQQQCSNTAAAAATAPLPLTATVTAEHEYSNHDADDDNDPKEKSSSRSRTPTAVGASALSPPVMVSPHMMHDAAAHGQPSRCWTAFWRFLMALSAVAAAVGGTSSTAANGGIFSDSRMRGGGADDGNNKKAATSMITTTLISFKTSFRSRGDEGIFSNFYQRQDAAPIRNDETRIYTVPSSSSNSNNGLLQKKKTQRKRNLDEDADGGDGGDEQDNQQQEGGEEEEEDGQEQDNNDAGQDNQQQEEEEEQDNSDQQEEEEEERGHSRDNNDDFFQDAVADDYVRDGNDKYNSSANHDDFYYAYIGEDYDTPHLWPLEEREIVGYAIAAMALTLGASGGIGGGGVVAPIYLLVMGLSPRVAIPIAAVTVLGGALASTMVNWKRRHPLADRPIMDWDLILVMQPVVLIGVFAGTFVHQILSEQVLVVLMVLFLSAMARSTLSKAMRMYQAELRYIRHLKAAQAEPPSGSPSRTFDWGDANDLIPAGSKSTEHMRNIGHFDDEEKLRILIENPDFVTLRSDLLEEEKLTPSSKIIVVISINSVLIVLNIMVGGGGTSPWGIKCGSPAFWTIHAIMIGFLITSAWAAQTYLIARHEIKNIVRFDYVHGDIRWNQRAGWLYPVVFMMAGLLAGMFGIGGGVIIVPLLLTIGTHPGVATSTSSAMMFFTNLASSSIYFAFGLILFDYAIVGFFVGFFSSLLGQLLMAHLRRARSASGRKFERNSYITFVIGGVVLVSAVLMTIQYIFSIVEGPNEDYGSLCQGLRF